ncbi:hypothetical protein FQZ97_1181590 [compost metagenome]
MKTNRKRLDQCEMTRRKRIVEDQLFGWQYDLLCQSTILLNTERLVVTAGIQSAFSARRAGAAIGVRQHDNALALGVGSTHALTCLDDLATNFVTRNTGKFHEWI